jgi:hypothetical protein
MKLFPWVDESAPVKDAPAPWCKRCFYRLDKLDVARCPECGKAFDPTDPETYVKAPPYQFWTFWIPGLLLAMATMIFWIVTLGLQGSIGYGLSIAAPMSAGAIIGYGTRSGPFLKFASLAFVLVGVIGSLIAMHPAMFLCAMVLGVICMIPVALGMLLGRLLRAGLSSVGFSQRGWFPIILMMFLPGAVDLLEHSLWPKPVDETISTSIVLPMSAMEAFDRWIFYEDAKGELPLSLRYGMPIPVRTIGKVTGVGDSKTCLYQHGRLVKRVTEFEPGKRIAFDVVEQTHVQDHAMKLTSGSFEFTPLGSGSCRVTLHTGYRPLLTPRLAWRPFERYFCHALHGHVLASMARGDRLTLPQQNVPADAGHGP